MVGKVEDEKSSNVEESKEGKKSKEISMTKVIMRRLPPTITESELLEQIAPLPPYDYFCFVPADMSLSPWAYSRAYFHLSSMDDVILFRDRFDGYVFMDPKGNEYPAMVELAPSQKIPVKKHKKDLKCATIDKDPAYQKFLEELQNPKAVELPSITNTLAEIEKRDKELKENRGNVRVKTPLIEYLVIRREEKRKRMEEKRKQKEDERIRREEERQRRIEREKAEAKKQTRLEEERRKEAETRLDEKYLDNDQQGPAVREKAPRFARKQSAPGRSGVEVSTDRDPGESGAKKSENEKTKIYGSDKRSGLENVKKKLDEKKERFFVEKNFGTKNRTVGRPRDSRDQHKPSETSQSTDTAFAVGKPKSKTSKYKDKPSVPIYQPSQRRKQLLEATEKPLLFKDADES